MVVSSHGVLADPHHHANGGGSGVPHGHSLFVENRVPAFGVEVGFVDDAGEPVGQGRDDPVGGAGHPPGIGRAPEHVVGVEVEDDRAGVVVGDHGAVYVNRPLGPPGRTAGEVQQRRGFGRCGRDLIRRIGRTDQRVEIVETGIVESVTGGPDE